MVDVKGGVRTVKGNNKTVGFNSYHLSNSRENPVEVNLGLNRIFGEQEYTL